MTSRLMARVMALLNQAGSLKREDRHRIASDILFRNVESFKDLSEIELRSIADTLAYWERQGELKERCQP